ncbi:MAG: spheroidene monooxygenase [Acidimicrobiales bacterium]
MVVSVHVADLGIKSLLVRPPKPAQVAGLLQADVGLCADLGPGFVPRLNLRRLGMVAFWEDQASLDGFLASDHRAAKMASGWMATLQPIRAFGSWPGLPTEVPRSRDIDSEGPVVVTTLGKLKMSQARRFLSTSAKAEARVLSAPGLRWSTGFGSPPFVATLSVWDSAQSVKDYAYGSDEGPEHPDAIDVDRAQPFHHRNAFIRFRPLSVSGSIDGISPIAAQELA